MTAPRRLFLALFILTLVLDQASKLYLFFVFDIAARSPVALTSFFDLTLVWNRGISYGLFQQSTELGRWLLTGFKLIATVVLSVWAWQAQEKWLCVGLGLIASGALGNAIDRILYGAVLDFAHFHWGTFSWYVFNVADAAIVVGVVFLLYDSFTSGSGQNPKSEKALEKA
ncbi:MAG: signal peptidase II [Beijerinckiaceae bacterium]